MERRRATAELADHQEKQKKYQAQLRNVQSSREYSAVLNEIDGVEKHRSGTAEDRCSTLEEEIETASARPRERARENLPRGDARSTREAEGLARGAAGDQRGARSRRRRRSATSRPRSRPRELAEFRRLAREEGGLAVARVVSSSCSACHVKVRPAAMQSLKAGREIIYCDSCKPDPLLRSPTTREWFRASIDGAARGNPGRRAPASSSNRTTSGPAEEYFEALGKATNNVAEYRALLLALRRAEGDRGRRRSRSCPTACCSCEQVNGIFKVKAPHLKPLVADAVRQRQGVPPSSRSGTCPREQNNEGRPPRQPRRGRERATQRPGDVSGLFGAGDRRAARRGPRPASPGRRPLRARPRRDRSARRHQDALRPRSSARPRGRAHDSLRREPRGRGSRRFRRLRENFRASNGG